MQPKWKEVQKTDDWRIMIDASGNYTAEAEVVQEIDDAPADERFDLFRFPLERFKVILQEDTRYLVPLAYEPAWPFPAVSYVPWFYKDLDSIAGSAGTEREALIAQLCSDDPIEIFRAYSDIGGHYGWRNFDHYPRRMSEQRLPEYWRRLP